MAWGRYLGKINEGQYREMREASRRFVGLEAGLHNGLVETLKIRENGN